MIIAVLLLPLALGLSALAVEGGIWYADRHDLRNMADAAVLAAGWSKLDGDSDYTAGLMAEDAAGDLGFDATDMDCLELNIPPTGGAYEGDADALEVVITRKRPLMLSTMFLAENTVTIAMRSVVRLGSDLSEACVLALHVAVDGAVDVGGNANITLDGCGIMANSIADDAIQVGGSADLDADYIAAVGGFSKSGSGDLTVDQQVTGTRPISDPFGAVAGEVPPGCDYSSEWSDGDGVPTPGSTFCGGMRVHGDLNLSPGTYYISGGDLTVNSSANLTGDGITFVVAGGGDVQINGGATVNLSAPTLGDYNGLLFVSTSEQAQTIRINGGSTMNLDGALYFRNQDVWFNGNNTTSGGCLRIVAQTVTFKGDSGLGARCEAYDMPSFAPNNDLSLVE